MLATLLLLIIHVQSMLSFTLSTMIRRNFVHLVQLAYDQLCAALSPDTAELALGIFFDLLVGGSRLKLLMLYTLHEHLPRGSSVLVTLTLLMLFQTHVHVLAVRRAVFGEEADQFNPFEYEYGDIRVDLGDSEDEEEGGEDSDTDEEEEEEPGEDEQDGDLFNDVIAMNGSLLSVMIAVALVSLMIQNIYDEKQKLKSNSTTANV